MKVLSLSTHSSNGGAAKTALDISNAVSSHCSIVHFTSESLYRTPPFSRSPLSSEYFLDIRRKLGRVPALFDSNQPSIYKSYSLLPSFFPKLLSQISPDLVHLHWIQGEFISIEDLRHLEVPVVWTMHDSWPFSSSEHHSLPDYIPSSIAYGSLKSWNPSRLTFARKLRVYRRLNIAGVAPSLWMHNKAAASELFGRFPNYIVPNPVELSIFCPQNPLQAREHFGIPADLPVLLLASLAAPSDPIKGFDLFLQSLPMIAAKIPNLVIVVAGSCKATTLAHPRVIYVGKIHSKREMALLYSAADVTCVPSRIETHSQTAAESISCGTPVAAFNASGNSSVVRHGQTGFLAAAYSPRELSKAVSDCFMLSSNENLVQTLRNASSVWNPAVVGKQYYEIYKNTLSAR